MDYPFVEAALFDQLETLWSTTPIAWPDQIPPYAPSSDPYIEPFVLMGESFQASIGSAVQKHRLPGIFLLRIFSPKDFVQRTCLGYAKTLSDAFTSKSVNSIRCGSPYISGRGVQGVWNYINLSIPFEYDESVTIS